VGPIRSVRASLWILIVAMLVIFTFMLIAVAIFAGFLRRRGWFAGG
jgi:hypothetical protein